MTGAPADAADAPGIRCSSASRQVHEHLAGTAPRAHVWVAVEHTLGWGDAELARSDHGVRVLMARGPRSTPSGSDSQSGAAPRLLSEGKAQADVADRGVRVWVGYCSPTPTLRVGRVEAPEVVADWDLAEIGAGSLRDWGRADPEPLLLVCANGRRDRCCGHSGGRLADSLWQGRHASRVLTSTHLGGHRFAPTALLLPVGALHGRLDVVSATALLDDAERGLMSAESLRGHSTLEEPAQVAEAHARVITGYEALAPMPVDLLTSGDPDRMHAHVRGWDPGDSGRSLEVQLVRSTGPALLSCARPPEATTRWSVAG